VILFHVYSNQDFEIVILYGKVFIMQSFLVNNCFNFRCQVDMLVITYFACFKLLIKSIEKNSFGALNNVSGVNVLRIL